MSTRYYPSNQKKIDVHKVPPSIKKSYRKAKKKHQTCFHTSDVSSCAKNMDASYYEDLLKKLQTFKNKCI
jgi:hypothetical protein